MELNLDGHDQTQPIQESEDVAKSVRPSVLERLNMYKDNSPTREIRSRDAER